ncbi:MAG: Ltp family lipoprotein [Marvinbryantia sp.]|uniref:Ltp family lipoprotein n=1 Tax=Marvinbryantia sp. TaxID=2496532 RepID=UPI00399AF826
MRTKKAVTVIGICVSLLVASNASRVAAEDNEFKAQKDILTHTATALKEQSFDAGVCIKLFEDNYDDVSKMTEYETSDAMAGFFFASVYLSTCYDDGTYAHEIGQEAVVGLEELYKGYVNEFQSHIKTAYGYYDEIMNKDNENDSQSDMTMGQKNALTSALSYLDYSAFSYTGLIEQLEYEGYSNEDAVFAVDNCGADWNEQAAKSAKSYLEYSAFSRDGLIEQLEYEGFTHEQAVYGVESNGY